MVSKSRYYAQDIALVMELRGEGVGWKVLGAVYGCHPDYLLAMVRDAQDKPANFGPEYGAVDYRRRCVYRGSPAVKRVRKCI
jgi:hypothetical protein